MGDQQNSWDADDDIDLYPERPRNVAGEPAPSLTPVVVGWVASVIASAVNIAVLVGLMRTASGTTWLVVAWMTTLAAIIVITLCGTFPCSRHRMWLVLAGVLLLLSPVVGFALLAASF